MKMRVVLLSEVASIGAGQSAPKDNEFNSSEGLPFIRAGHLENLILYNNIKDLPKVSDSYALKNRLRVIKKGSILFAKSGMSAMMNRVYLVTQDSYFVSHLASVTPNESYLDSRFCYFFLKFFGTSKLIKDSAYPSIGLPDIQSIKTPLPPLETQKRIADILDAADALRKKDQELLKKYDELAQAIFIDMFGDPVKNEKGWEKHSIGSITKVGSGGTPSRQRPEYFTGTIPWVKTTEVNGSIIINTEEKITIEALNNSSCKIYPKDSIIIAMYGQGKTRGQVGILGVPAATNQACGVISPTSKLIPEFLLQYLKMSYHDLRGLGRGGNQENLNKGMIENYLINIPPLSLQKIFKDRVENIFQQLNKSKNQESSLLFDSVSKRVFSEELLVE